MNNLIKTATISELSSGLKNKEFSSTELTAAYLNQAKKQNDTTGAYINILEEYALTSAAKADEKIKNGSATPLTGIPIAVKDNICLKNTPTTCGSKMLAEYVSPYSATALNRLEDEGAVIIGKTNMDEFAMGSASQTSYFGGVKNPYDLKRVAGGSSGGSAAAVATFTCPAALGSDTGGSVRQPAAFCGITGLKPTYGTVSRYGLVAFASSLDQIGPMARTAYDCGLLLNAISGADEFDFTAANRNVTDYTALCGTDVKDAVIGLPKEFFDADIDAEVKSAVLAAAEVYKNMGYIVKEVSLPSLKYAVAAYYLISSAEAASNLSRYDGIKYTHRSKKGKTYEDLIKNTRREGFGWEVKRRIMLGNYALSSGYYDAYYNKAVAIRAKIKAEYDELFKTCSFVLTPTTPTTAYKIGNDVKNAVKMYSADILTVTANIAGLPAISTTCGYDKNCLPIGMSLIGPAFGEDKIIAAADRFEKTFIRREAEV